MAAPSPEGFVNPESPSSEVQKVVGLQDNVALLENLIITAGKLPELVTHIKEF